MSDDREWCDYSELHKDECEHCDPTERERKSATYTEAERTWAERHPRVVYPLPKARTERRVTTTTPKWNPGNVAAEIGGHLTAIEEMFMALREEAEARHSDREFPGGDAMVMLGPGADVEAWGYAQISAMVGRIDEKDIVVPTKRDLEPPLSFLAGWTDIIRDERDQPTYLAATIEGEIRYIRSSIDWMFSLDDNGVMRFIQVDDLAAGLAKVRRRLEDILKDGSRAEFTRVNCIAEQCQSHPRLMKLWAAQVRWDRYRCPDCRTEYDTAQFNQAKAQNLHSQGAEEFVLVADATKAADVPKQTMHSWLTRINVRSVCDITTHRVLVWWPDVRDRATERRRERKAS